MVFLIILISLCCSGASPLTAGEAVTLPQALTSPICIGCQVTDPVHKRLNSEEWEKLLRGKILVRKLERSLGERETTARVVAIGLIPRSPLQVWKALFTFHRWPEFLPNLTAVKIVRIHGERLWLWHRIKILIVSLEYTVIYDFAPERGVAHWQLDHTLPNDIEDTVGYWGVEPVKEGVTLLTYEAYVRVGRLIPAFVEDLLTRESLPRIVEGVREEVLTRFPPSGS